MDRRITALLVVAIGIALLISIGAMAILIAPPAFLYEHSSTYSYTTSITTNTTLENVTVRLPFPSDATGSGPIDDIWIYDGNGTELQDWNPTVVDTAEGPVLEVTTDSLPGSTDYLLFTYSEEGQLLERRQIDAEEIPENLTNREVVAQPTTYRLSWQSKVDSTIETRWPIGNVTFLQPVTGVHPTACPEPADRELRCSTFETVVTATFDADSPAAVVVGPIEYTGSNEWGFWLSNSYNSFEATTTPAVYTDGDTDVRVVDGRLRAGEGRYDGPPR